MSKVDILKQHQLLEATGHTRPSMAAALTHSVDWNQSVSFQAIESVNKSDCLVVGRRSLGISAFPEASASPALRLARCAPPIFLSSALCQDTVLSSLTPM